MARHHITEPRVKDVVDRLVDQFIRLGSVNALAEALTKHLGENSARIYPNRLHGLLAEDPARSVNSSTLAAIEQALGAVESEVFVGDESLKQRVSTELAVLPPTTADPVAAVAATTGLPPAVVRKLAGHTGPHDNREPHHGARTPDWRWQDDAVNAALRALRKRPDYRAGLVIPTGGGKTRIALRIALQWLAADGRAEPVVLWITHRRRLQLQARRALQRLLRDGEGIPEGAATLFAKEIRFVMIHDAASAIAAAGENLALVIVDEAHHAAAPSYEPVFTDAAVPALFLTATPNRTDALPIGIDEVAYTITYRELFERACLVEPVFDPPLELRGLDWSQPEGLRDLADYLLDRTESDFGKVLVAVSLRDRAEVLYEAAASLLDEKGEHPLSRDDIGFVHAERSSGSTNPADFLDEFTAKPKGILVATSQLVGEGYDDPTIDSVVVTYPSTSIGHLMQVAGRALRASPDKTTAHVVQVRESPLEYHFDQRWLYQDISDALRPALIDVTYSRVDDLRRKVLELLALHRVPTKVVDRIAQQLAQVDSGDAIQLMLTGVPHFAAAEAFETSAEWGALLVTPEERHRFVQVFNDVSCRVDDIKEHGAYLRHHLPPDTRAGSLWKSYVDLVTSMEYARREISGIPYAGENLRPYTRGRSTTWLRYVSFKFEPAVPEELERFLEDAINRDAVVASFLSAPQTWFAAVKIELPLSGMYGYLLDETQAGWLEEQRAVLTDVLRHAEGLERFAAIGNWSAHLDGVGVPNAIVTCISQLTRPERHAVQHLDLQNLQIPVSDSHG